MKLVIGGYAQGKLEYVMKKYGAAPDMVWDGELPGNAKMVVINHFHNWVKRSLSEGRHPEEEIRTFLERHQDCIIISDEIGNGIIPADVFEREYRERTGRILVELAEKAEEVERVICGIGQKIK